MNTAEIRQSRINLAKGKCEFCGKQAVTAHHIFLGRKQRLKSEMIETVRAVCAECHDYLHHKGFELLKKLQIEACNDLIKKYGEDETRKILGKIYF